MTNASAVDPVARLPAPVRAEWAALATPTPAAPAFDPGATRELPEPVRRWLVHAVAAGTPLRRRVELTQHGRIRIRSWRPFTARHVTAGLESLRGGDLRGPPRGRRRRGAAEGHHQRWARVDRGPYQLRRFGAEVHGEATFAGFTVPRRVTAGHDDDSPRWPDCAFIEITVDDATYL